MGFNRQLDIFVASAAAVISFVGCIFMIEIAVKFSLFIAAGVFLGGFVFGRGFAAFVTKIFS